MPDSAVVQYGSFGLVVFVTVTILVWFIKIGFPKTLDTLTSAIDRVLTKIDQIERDCREERREDLKAFREECESLRRAFRDESDANRQAFREESEANRQAFRDDSNADREARHKQGGLLQQSVVEMTESFVCRAAQRG